MKTWRATVTVLLCATALGCAAQIPFLAPGAAPPVVQGSEAGDLLADTGLRGIVQLAAFGYRPQASMADVGNGATVSLIDTSTNLTVSTALTTASGQFSMSFSGGFRPVGGRSYYLEAIKGLAGNAPSNNAARLRTVLLWQSGGWTSITGAVPGSGVTVNQGTTALAAILGLRSATGTPVTAASLIGKVRVNVPDSSLSPTTPDTFTPVSNCTNQDFHTAWEVVSQALSADRDPIQAISLNTDTNTFFLNTTGGGDLTLTSLSPSTGSVGTAVAIHGANFDPIAANNIVLFGNRATASVAGTSTVSRLDVTVPSGALSDQISVRRANTISLGPNFVVVPTIASFSPTSATTGTSVVITGTGFDPNAANDTVQFNEVTAVVTAASATSLTVTVPATSTKGRVTVATTGGTATSATDFTVKPSLSGLSANPAATGSTLILTGTGFAATGSVSFSGINASVSAWSNTSITATVPANAINGPVTVTTTTGVSNSMPFVVWQWCDGGKICWDPAGNFYYVTDSPNLYKVPAGSSTPQLLATHSGTPTPNFNQVLYGPDGNLWLSDYAGCNLVKFNLNSNTFSVQKSLNNPPLGMAWSPDQQTLFIVGGAVYKYDRGTDTMTGPLAGSPITNRSVVCDVQGNAYFTSGNTQKIHKIASGSVAITNFVNLGVPPMGLGIDPTNNLYFQWGGKVTKFNIATPAASSTVATGLDTNGYHNLLYRDADGMLYSLFPGGPNIGRVNPSTNASASWVTTAARAAF